MRPSNREIRLLALLPGVQDDPIRCTIQVVSLDDDWKYEALSYVWGERTEEMEIQVDDRSTTITRNLYAGLRRLRYPNQKRTLWVDQLCINQWDNEEKATQVALMRDIYRGCSQCVIWMGEIGNEGEDLSRYDAEHVFDFLKQVAAVETTPITELPTLFKATHAGEAARRAFAAFSMYRNAWWSRIWTVQEAIIPRSAELVWGPLTIRREVVLDAARNIRKIHQPGLYSAEFIDCRFEYLELLRRLLYPVHGFNHSKTDGTVDLLLRWRHRQATDPRDKVYALLGLIRPGLIPSVQLPDYDLAAPDLFARVTADLIRLEGGLRPLLAATEMPHSTSGMPSWAIDFACSNRISGRQMKWWNHSHRYQEFSACKDHRLQIQIQDEGKTLGLAGTFLDDVLEVSNLVRVEVNEHLHIGQLLQSISDCQQMISRYRGSQPDADAYLGEESWNAAFWRTLLGDLAMDDFPLHRIGGNRRRYLLQLQEKFEEDMTAYRSRKETYEFLDTEETWKSDLLSHLGQATLDESLMGMVINQAFFITRSGYIGIGPPETQPGDQVWVFFGGNVPFIMRQWKEGDHGRPQLTLVGDAYVHGVMDGEALDDEPHMQTVSIH